MVNEMETLESIIFGLKETIKEKDAEIARKKDIIQKQCEFVEKLEADYGKLVEENAYKNYIIDLLNKDIEDLHKALEKRVEDVYEDFMKDYKLMREELDECCGENFDLQNKLWDLQDDFDNLLAEGKQQAVKDTAKEILTAIKEDKSGYWDSCDCGKEELHWRDKCVEDTLRMIAEKYHVEVE